MGSRSRRRRSHEVQRSRTPGVQSSHERSPAHPSGVVVARHPDQNCREEAAGTMFHVSRRFLGLIAAMAIALFIVGIATNVGLFGWGVAIILGAYVVVMLVRGPRR